MVWVKCLVCWAQYIVKKRGRCEAPSLFIVGCIAVLGYGISVGICRRGTKPVLFFPPPELKIILGTCPLHFLMRLFSTSINFILIKMGLELASLSAWLMILIASALPDAISRSRLASATPSDLSLASLVFIASRSAASLFFSCCASKTLSMAFWIFLFW